jgi:hypothetical protein
VSQLAVKGTKLTFAFSAGWLWIPLLVAAVISAENAQLAVAIAFVLVGLCVLGTAIALSVLRGAVRFAALAGLALGLVVASAFAPVTVPSYDTYTNVGFGYPFHFVFADLSYHEPLPHPTTEAWNPWEEIAVLDIPRFLLSYAAVFVALTAISLGARETWRWVRRSRTETGEI